MVDDKKSRATYQKMYSYSLCIIFVDEVSDDAQHKWSENVDKKFLQLSPRRCLY